MLEARSLYKSFSNRKIVNGFSCYIKPGEAVALLGPNGAGKTTSFYMITGLVRCDSGSIFMDGYDITKYAMYKRARLGMGYLPQEASIFRGLTVYDNIRAVLEMVSKDSGGYEAKIVKLLHEFNIEHLRDSMAISLSGGERRRLEIARALVVDPQYILFDEPFAGVDPIAVNDIKLLVKQLTQRGIGVFITDHNVRETLSLVDRAYIMHNGKELIQGKPSEIIADPHARRLYLGADFYL